MTTNRRQLITGAVQVALASALGAVPALADAAPIPPGPYAPPAGPRSRMVYVNDLCGDIDGLFSAVHAVLSPTSQVRAIVGTGTGRPGETAQRSAALAREMLGLMKRSATPVHEGAAKKLADIRTPIPSPGSQAIIDEALRTDTKLPLFVAVGGGLTEVASAVMLEPTIADRFTLVWIGGDAWPAGGTGETNFNIDPLAAQFLFNETNLRIWQIPRAAYGTQLVSDTELQTNVRPCGAIGAWLYGKIFEAAGRWGGAINVGETWCLGDSPLVVVTSLGDWPPSAYRPVFLYERTGSSPFDEVIAPHLNSDGTFAPRSEGRKIRIYRGIDTRMMIADFFAKLRVNSGK